MHTHLAQKQGFSFIISQFWQKRAFLYVASLFALLDVVRGGEVC